MMKGSVFWMYINWIQYLFQMRMKTGDSSFLAVRAGLQNVLQIFVTNAANVFLLEVSPEYPILLEEQVKNPNVLKFWFRMLMAFRFLIVDG